MTDQLRAIVNIIKDVLTTGYGSVTVCITQGKITKVEKREDIKV
jgi:hypothetical protein